MSRGNGRFHIPLLQHWRQSQKKKEQERRETFAFRATPVQAKLMSIVASGLYRIIGFGGGIRSTKTFGVLAVIITLCRIFPRSRWAIVRKDLPTLRRNVVPSMEKLRLMSGGFVGPLNQSVWTYMCANGSEILLFAEQFQQDPELERWKGLEVNGFVLEEGSELNEKSANKAIERAGSYIIPGLPDDPEPKQPPPLILVTFNPCRDWPRMWFYMPWRAGTIKAPYYFLPATIQDNPYATEEYKDSLKLLPKAEYDRFVMGEWDFVDDPDQLIKSEWIWNARNVEPVGDLARLGADVARYGDDYSTMARVHGNALRGVWEWRHLSTDRFATFVLNEAQDRNAPVDAQHVLVDSVGVGAGTVDFLHRSKFYAREFIAGAKAVERPGAHFKFKDLRSQAWWEFREKLRLGQFCLSLVDKHGNEIPLPEKLVADLAAPRYEISGERLISVESKEDIKLRLGRSTDYGDAVVMAAFDMPPAPRRPVLPGTFVRA